MKRFILAALALGFCICASAGSPKPALRLGWSMSPVTTASHFGEESARHLRELQYLYKDYHTDVCSTGNFNLAFDMEFNEWLTGSIYLAYAGFDTDRFDGHTGEKTGEIKGQAFFIVPHVRFTYYNTEHFRAYGTLGAGYCRYAGFENRSGSGVIQFNPAGVEYGRKLFCYAELGFGTMFFGGHIGVGYKF